MKLIKIIRTNLLKNKTEDHEDSVNNAIKSIYEKKGKVCLTETFSIPFVMGATERMDLISVITFEKEG